MSDSQLDAFLEYLETRAYTAVTFTGAGIRLDGATVNLVSRLVYGYEQTSDSFNFDIGPYQFLRRTLPVTRVGLPLDLPTAQTIHIRDHIWHLRGDFGRTYQWHYWDVGERGLSKIGWPTALARGSGVSQGDLAGVNAFHDLGRRIVALSDGRFGSLAHLGRVLGAPGSPFTFDQTDASYLDLYAPTYSRFAVRPVLVSTSRELQVLIESREPAGFMLYVTHDDLDGAMKFPSTLFSRSDEGHRGLSVKLPTTSGPYELQLVVDGVTLQRRRVGFPEITAEIHGLIDVDWKWLAGLRRQRGTGRNSQGFEEYVAMILQFLGYPAVHYGQGGHLPSAPDVVAELQDDEVLVGECTVVSPTSEKVQQLHSAALSLAQGLWDRTTLKMQLVLFHATSHAMVSPGVREKSQHCDVRLIGLEKLEGCERMLRDGESREVIRRFLFDE